VADEAVKTETDPTVVEFPITLGKKTFTLTFPVPSVWAFEDATGLDITSGELKVKDIMGDKPKLQMQRTITLLWAGLLAKHPEVASNATPADRQKTMDAVGRFVYFKNLGEITAKVFEAFMATIPAETDVTDGIMEPVPGDSTPTPEDEANPQPPQPN